MSAEDADIGSAENATVDMSKKMNRCSKIEQAKGPDYEDSHYSVVDKKEKEPPQPVSPYIPKSTSSISMHQKGESSHHDAKQIPSGAENQEQLVGKSSTQETRIDVADFKHFSIVGLIVVIVLSISLFVCFIVSIVAINSTRRLVTDMTSLKLNSTNSYSLLESSIQEGISLFQKNYSLLQSNYSLLQRNYDMLQNDNWLLQNEVGELRGRVNNISNMQGHATSCASLPPFFPSAHYWFGAIERSSIAESVAIPVYCDMTRTCGGVTGGWTRVSYLDMTDDGQQCPSDLIEGKFNDSDIRTCVRSSDSAGCTPITLPVHMTQYSQVCGRVIAYQYGGTNAFKNNNNNINSAYVDGVSLTHGTPREHIWTFAATLDKTGDFSTLSNCPCTQNMSSSSSFRIPSFVGDDYFCDAGNQQHVMGQAFQFHSADPLWDGAGCELPNTCCSFNNPPWFYKQLPQPTTDDIEMRVCRNEDNNKEDIAIEIVEIYVQ